MFKSTLKKCNMLIFLNKTGWSSFEFLPLQNTYKHESSINTKNNDSTYIPALQIVGQLSETRTRAVKRMYHTR